MGKMKDFLTIMIDFLKNNENRLFKIFLKKIKEMCSAHLREAKTTLSAALCILAERFFYKKVHRTFL